MTFIGGFFLKKEFNNKELIRTEGPRIEKYIKYNYMDITTVTFLGVKTNPTGIPHIKGYVNNNPRMEFDASLGAETFNAGLNFFEEAPEHKFKNYDTFTVDEIEEKEQENK